MPTLSFGLEVLKVNFLAFKKKKILWHIVILLWYKRFINKTKHGWWQSLYTTVNFKENSKSNFFMSRKCFWVEIHGENFTYIQGKNKVWIKTILCPFTCLHKLSKIVAHPQKGIVSVIAIGPTHPTSAQCIFGVRFIFPLQFLFTWSDYCLSRNIFEG